MRIHRFAQRLWVEWQKLALPVHDAGLLVAVSGGADSLALLLALDELRGAGRLSCALTVAHFNHGLRPESTADALWVADEAARRGYPCIAGAGDVGAEAAARKDNLEQAARRARYNFLEAAAEASGHTYVLTAHTLDDQAETVLLNLLRGSGPDGLGGMKPLRPLATNKLIWLGRPLLSWARRAGTQEYCRTQNIVPRPDAMNEDERFARVRVRRQLLPLLETFNGRAVAALGRTAELLRDEAQVMQQAAAELLEAALTGPEPSDVPPSTVAPLSVKVLADAPKALQRRALRLWLSQARGDTRRLAAVHLQGVESLLKGVSGGRRAELPGGGRVTRRGGKLYWKSQTDA